MPHESHETQEPQAIETPYAIAKMEESAWVIRQAMGELFTLRRRLEKNKDIKSKAREIYGDMQNQQRRLLSSLDAAALSLLEAEQADLANYSVKLVQSVNSFNLLTPDYSKLCDVLNNYLSALPLPDLTEGSGIFDAGGTDSANEKKTTSARIIGRLMNNVRMGYYPTCTDNLAYIARGLEIPEEVPINLLDPCCGCGIALRSLADSVTANGNPCKTYGIEIDGHRAEEALTRIDRVGFGSFYRSRISNEAFHAMLLNPPYLSVMTEGGNNIRSERKFLVDSVSYLMMGGLLIYIIPYYRLAADICRLLCDNFDNIGVWKFTSGEFKRFNQVAILGTRRKRRDGSGMVAALAALALEPDNLPELTELPAGSYKLPNTSKEVVLFKGAQFNVAELSEQLSKSKSLSRLFTHQSKLDDKAKRPLLPLSLSQIGLVGGSGLINGRVECDTPHIIKGRIIKEKIVRSFENTNEDGDLMSTTVTETTSNKLIFNLLTPDGFVSLTNYDSGGTTHENDPSDDDSRLGRFVSGCFDAGDSIGGDTDKNNRFPLGRVVITCGAREVLTDSDVTGVLQRHASCDWGTVCNRDGEANNKALQQDGRILSSYLSPGGVDFWVNTEADRSVTTVLLPEEY